MTSFRSFLIACIGHCSAVGARDRACRRRPVRALVLGLAAGLLLPRVSGQTTTLYSWENSLQGWANASSGVYTFAFSTTVGVTDGTSSLACTKTTSNRAALPDWNNVIQIAPSAAIQAQVAAAGQIQVDIKPVLIGGTMANAYLVVNTASGWLQSPDTGAALTPGAENTATWALTSAQQAAIKGSPWYQLWIAIQDDGAAGSVFYLDNYRLVAPVVPLAITLQPAGQVVNAGDSATFTVVATGTSALSYQWQKGTAALTGQTGASLTLTAVQSADAGSYSVIVTNASGAVTSSSASLTVNPAQPVVNLTVDATRAVRTVDERVFGINAVTWDGQTGSAQTIALLKAAGVRAVRIPAGSGSDIYHWRAAHPGSEAAFDSFTRLITGLNAQAFITVNYGSGTPEEAAAWVAYTNSSSTLLGTGGDVTIGVDANRTDWKTAGYWSALRAATPLATDDGLNFLRLGRSSPFALKQWEVGNECYGSWENDTHTPQWDPVTYATYAATYIAKMKAVDPTIRIGAVVEAGEDALDAKSPVHNVTNPRTGVAHHGWTPVVLATFKALSATPDFLVYHRYEQTPGQETDAGLLQAASTWPADATMLRQLLTDYLGAAGANVELCVTENNSVYSNPGKQTTSLVDGLYLADSVGQVLQTEFNSLVWWDLRNGQDTSNNLASSLYGWRQYGDYGIMSAASDCYPTYYAMKLLAHFARGGDTVVPAASPNKLLAIFAARRTDGTLSLLVINKDPVNTLSANVALTGFTPVGTASIYQYGKAQDRAAQTGYGSADLAASNLSVGGSALAASFPAYSLTVIALSPGGAPTFTTPPAGQTVASGTAATFRVAASGTPAPTLQWQVSTDGAASWTTLTDTPPYTGTATDTLTLANVNVALSGDQFRAVAANGVGTVNSPAATLTVSPAAQTITFAGPADQPFSAAPIALSASADSGLPVSFAVIAGPATVSGSALTLTGAGRVTVEASQPGSSNYAAAVPVDRSFVVLPNLASWQQIHFTAAERLDPKISGPTAVLEPDGLSNLVKYALGLDPRQSVTAGLPAASRTATDWVYTYTRPTATADVACSVEVSTDLLTWTSAGVTLDQVSSAGGVDTWRWLFPVAGTSGVFFRLKATQ